MDTPEMASVPATTDKRPIIITIICVLGIIGSLITLGSFFIPVVRMMALDLYGPMFFGASILAALVGLASFIGLWKMKKWGLYLYVAGVLIGAVAGLVVGIPFNALGYIVPVIIIAICLFYFKRMR